MIYRNTQSTLRKTFMITFTFMFRGSQVTWFISANLVMLFNFLFSYSVFSVVKRVRKSRQIKDFNKKLRLSNPTGGDFIDRCIDGDGVYELVDPYLEVAIRKILDLGPKAGTIILSLRVFILTYIISQRPLHQITLFGVQVVFDKITKLTIRSVIGVLCGSLLAYNPAGLLGVGGALFSTLMLINLAQGIDHAECSQYVSKVPLERVASGKTVGYLDRPIETRSRIFISDNTDVVLYSPRVNNYKESCNSEYKEVKMTGLNFKKVKSETPVQIKRTCKTESTYTPLSELPLHRRTKKFTEFSDINNHDSSSNIEKAESYLKNHERKRVKNQRSK